jgi:uncharacterized membrane-anchored protein
MKNANAPKVDARYWTALTLAGAFSANLSTIYAHESGFEILKSLAFLTLLAAIVCVAERFTRVQNEVYYWLAVTMILTGAAKIADYLAFHVRVPRMALTLGLIGLLFLFDWRRRRASPREGRLWRLLPKTGWAGWMAMLAGGVFGMAAGDMCSRKVGEAVASLCLAVILVSVLLVARRRTGRDGRWYWTAVAIALTAGASIGAWMAHNTFLNGDLSFSGLISGLAFLDVLVFWRTHSSKAPALVESAS